MPYELAELKNGFDILITLKYDNNNIRMDVVKDHENQNASGIHLFLDPKTLLIADA